MAVSRDDIKKMNELYLEYKTYAEVARQTGFSPSTVKKYIVPNFRREEDRNIIRFDQPLPDFDPKPFRVSDWGPLCVLSDEEINALTQLWEELDL